MLTREEIIADLQALDVEKERLKEKAPVHSQAYIDKARKSNTAVANIMGLGLKRFDVVKDVDDFVWAVRDILGNAPADKYSIGRILRGKGLRVINPYDDERMKGRRAFFHHELMPEKEYCFALVPDYFTFIYNGFVVNLENWQNEKLGFWDIFLDAEIKSGGQRRLICYWVMNDSEENAMLYTDRVYNRKVRKYGQNWKHGIRTFNLPKDVLAKEAELEERESQ